MRELVGRTDGIPLFIEEMTRRVLEGGEVASIPATLHELLLARLDLLPSRQKSLAQLVRGGGEGLLAGPARGRRGARGRRPAARAGGAGGGGAAPGGAGGTGEPGYQFRHALFQEAAYQSLHARRAQAASPAHRAGAGGALPRGGGGPARGARAPSYRGGTGRAGHPLLVPGRGARPPAHGQPGGGDVPHPGAGTAARAARGRTAPGPGVDGVGRPGQRPGAGAGLRLAGGGADAGPSDGTAAADGRVPTPARTGNLEPLQLPPDTGGVSPGWASWPSGWCARESARRAWRCSPWAIR